MKSRGHGVESVRLNLHSAQREKRSPRLLIIFGRAPVSESDSHRHRDAHQPHDLFLELRDTEGSVF